MKKSLLLILFHICVYTVFSQSFIDTISAFTYVPYGFVKLDSVINNDISYKYYGDSSSGRFYVSCNAVNFTNSNILVGSEFLKVNHLGNLKNYKGWGYYLELSSGWNAYLCFNKSEIDSSKVLFFFSTKKKVFERIIAR
jgi:hypothetical protein